MTKIIILTEIQSQVLAQLGIYRFLTADQIVRLGVSQSIDYLRKNTLKKLQSLKLTGFAVTQKAVLNNTHLHYITEKGARVLAEQQGVNLSQINYPTGKVKVVSHIPHMIKTIDCGISARLWAIQNEIDLSFAHFDFEKQRGTGAVHVNGRPQSLTRINVPYEGKGGKEADFLFMATIEAKDKAKKNSDPKEENYVYALELENYPDTSNIANKLMHYTEIILSGWTADNFETAWDMSILSVYDNENALKLVPKILNKKAGFSNFKDFFFFNSLEQVKKDFSKGWKNSDGENKNPFGSA